MTWLKRAFDLGRINPKAIFGGAALLLAVLLLVTLGGSVLMAMVAVMKPAGAIAVLASMLFTGALMALMAVLFVGYLRLLDAVEQGRDANVMTVFSGVGDRATTLRAIGFMLVLMLVQNLLLFGLVALLAPEFGSWYLKVAVAGAGQTPPTALPSGFGTALALLSVIGMFSFAVQAIGLGQIALRGRSVGAALTDGLLGAARNLLPLLVLFVLMFLATVVLFIVAGVLILVVGLLAKLVGAWLLVLIGIPLYVAFMVGLMVVMFGVMYYLWRDVCDDGLPPLPSDGDAFEA